MKGWLWLDDASGRCPDGADTHKAAAATGASVKAGLAGYQAPERVLMTDIIGRVPNGGVDDRRLRQYAAERA